ncbi:MAG: peptidoglycan DD-metalloendopeptidase family protein [Bacteroidales bacterium]|nr:peptidoglycan DD-metalloendopeptidase family protein [Bacteroidales bacterium]
MKQPCAVLLCLLALSLQLHAQQPRRLTYFDSLAYRQQYGHYPKATEKAVDSALMKGDDLIDLFYDESKPLPSALWYGNTLLSTRVRQQVLPLDSLPDEINIRLIKEDNEFCFPVKHVRTSPYGWRWNRPHRGVDIALNVGDPVHCAFPGVVRIARPMGGYGNLVVVRHYNGLETVYGHLSKINVRPKQLVRAGDVIGLGGSTGHSTGPHLHFEVRFEYEAFDPEWILDFSNYSLRTRRLHLDKTYFGITAPKGKNCDLAYKADKSYVKEDPRKYRQEGKKKEQYHTVKSTDTYDMLALQYSTTVEKIKKLNPDAPKKLKTGMIIRVR